MDNLDKLKTTFAKNLSNVNFNTTISMPIDTNVNIKTILDINSYLYDETIECGNGKAIFSGKIGMKVIYLDTDNITNSIANTQSFSETIIDNSITGDCYINMMNSSLSNNVLTSDGTLKINCDINISPVMYMNLGSHADLGDLSNMIVKKSELSTTAISNIIDKKINYTINLETKDKISKILEHNAYFSQTNITTKDNVAIVEGKMYSNLLFETIRDDEYKLAELQDCFNVKFDIDIDELSSDSELDLIFRIDKSAENISTETEDDNNIIIINNTIRAVGVAIKNITIEVVDDLFSTNTDIDLNISSRDYLKPTQKHYMKEVINNEILLLDNESAIDDVVSNLNIIPEVTNSYIKDDLFYIEGIITSHLVYIDENKDMRQKKCEIPFIVNTKLSMTELCCTHTEVNIEDSKCRVKRGTIIELEYSMNICVCSYQRETKDIVDSISIGKPIDYSQYDYQIYLAKPNETLWELCKRIKITPEDIKKSNPTLSDIMLGGEKVIIKR